MERVYVVVVEVPYYVLRSLNDVFDGCQKASSLNYRPDGYPRHVAQGCSSTDKTSRINMISHSRYVYVV